MDANFDSRLNQQDELKASIEADLLKFATQAIREFLFKMFRASWVLVILRIILLVFFNHEMPLKAIILPMVGGILSFLLWKFEIQTKPQHNLVACLFRILMNIVCFENCLGLANNKLFYILLLNRAVFFIEQIQILSPTLKIGQSVMLYLYFLVRICQEHETSIQPNDLMAFSAAIYTEFVLKWFLDNLFNLLVEQVMKIRQLEQRWLLLLQHIKLGVCIFQESSLKLSFCNQSLISTLDLQGAEDLEERLQNKGLVIKKEQDKEEIAFGAFLQRILKQLYEEPNQVPATHTVKIKESKKVVEVSLQLFEEKAQERSIMVMVQDVTSLQNLQKQKSLQRMKTIYFCSVAHDLKTPINSIMAANEGLLSRFEGSAFETKLLKVTKTSCQFLLRIIEDITDLSRIELREFSLSNCWFNLSSLVEEVIETMSLPLAMKRIYCRYSIEDEALTEKSLIFSDPKRLQQILFNLIGNALKFTFEGGILLTIRSLQEQEPSIVEELKEDSDDQSLMLQFEVQDSGIGIKEESMGQLFKLFGKVRESSEVNRQGIGLGLTICKKLCELLEGSISVESVYGQGSKFLFSIKTSVRKGQEELEVETEEVGETEDNGIDYRKLLKFGSSITLDSERLFSA